MLLLQYQLQPAGERANEYYVMYPNVCFDAVIDASGYGKILMTYSIEGVEKLLPNSDLSGELEFKTAVAPTLNRFIVGNDSNTYEWDTENDALVRKYNCVYCVLYQYSQRPGHPRPPAQRRFLLPRIPGEAIRSVLLPRAGVPDLPG